MDQIGKYHVVRVVGEGGMGRVYEATDPIINRRVAIKTISQGVLQDLDTRARFFREAQAAGQLSHPNLITIFDVGEMDGSPFIVMEYLEGEELSRVIARRQLSFDAKLRVIIEVCQGLGYAHSKGLIHRDIKPANIFVTTAHQVKILDFGLARGAVSEITQTGRVVGTPSYMAPEQVRGDRVDHRADIFAVGVVLYELLSGQKAFRGDTVAATIFQVLERQPDPLEQLDPDLPPGISKVVQRALAKDPNARYQRIDDMLAELTAIRIQAQPTMFLPRPATPYPGGAVSAGSIPPATPSPSIAPPTTPAPSPAPGSTPSATPVATPTPVSGAAAPASGRLWLPWAVAAGVAAAAVAFVLITRPTSTPPPAPPSTRQPAPPSEAAAAKPVERPPSSVPGDAQPKPDSPGQPAVANEPQAAAEKQPAAPPARTPERDLRAPARSPGRPAEPPAPRARSAAPATPPPDARPEPPAPVQPREPSPPPVQQHPTPPVQQHPALPETKPAPPPAPVPPTAPVAPPATSAAPPPVPVDPAAGIAETMARYKGALEARDLGALKQIWPGLAGRQETAIRNEFENARAIAVDLQGVTPSVANNAATVVCRRNYEVTTVDGRTLRTATRMTVTLTRRNGSWIIENIRHEAER